jgi:hypothetical protein
MMGKLQMICLCLEIIINYFLILLKIVDKRPYSKKNKIKNKKREIVIFYISID